ncbi:hypothetical protein ACFL02_07830, partial [Planctomycetota bacterium]
MPGRNDVDIEVGVKGVPQTKREFDKLGKASRQLGDDVAKGGDRAEASYKKLDKSFASFIAKYGGMAAVIASGSKLAREELEALTRAANDAAQSLEAARDLMFLTGFAAAHPEAQAEIGTMAQTAALPVRGC